ncbi:MAG: hypothetical protein ABI367_06695 [Mucilaginibacter sp.]
MNANTQKINRTAGANLSALSWSSSMMDRSPIRTIFTALLFARTLGLRKPICENRDATEAPDAQLGIK